MSNEASVFISYSTLDEAVGRKVRNLFEERGHDALLLKLHQRMTEEFIKELLRNEVQARDWVVTVDSEHAEQSTWVAFERSIAGIYHKPIYHVDADCAHGYRAPDAEDNCIRAQVSRISRRLRVYLSYSHEDQAIAVEIADALHADGYEVFYDHFTVIPGGAYREEIARVIDETLERGIMLVLVSANSMRSRWVEAEITYGLSTMRANHGIIIPVLIPPSAPLPPTLEAIQSLDLRQNVRQGIAQLPHAIQYWK